MLLLIDAGNTTISIGAMNQDEIVFESRLATDKTATRDRFAIDIMDIFALNKVSNKAFSGAIISSVVPEITMVMKKAITKVIGIEPLVIGPGLKTGLNIKVDNPATLGADLVVGAVGAIAQYELPCLVIDLGTATKISVIDENGIYRGCTISPGVSLSLDALANGASQLSQISLLPPSHVIGTNTIECMRAGSVYGTADMLDGLCSRMEKELGMNAKTIVATGGLCDIAKYCSHDIILNKDLLLEGLKIVYEKNN